MGNDKSGSNIITFADHDHKDRPISLQSVGSDDASIFIVDMLDRLMRIAAKNDKSILVYLLSMARIEALNSRKAGE